MNIHIFIYFKRHFFAYSFFIRFSGSCSFHPNTSSCFVFWPPSIRLLSSSAASRIDLTFSVNLLLSSTCPCPSCILLVDYLINSFTKAHPSSRSRWFYISSCSPRFSWSTCVPSSFGHNSKFIFLI